MRIENQDWMRPRALYEGVAASLRARIFAHEFAPGCPLDEAGLARAYGVSRTPVREALKVLGREGLVEIEPRRGCCVAALSGADVAGLLSAIALLGLHAVREAAHSGIQPAAPAGLAELLECGGNPHLTDALLRLNDKIQLACGPQFSTADGGLLAASMPALSSALAGRRRAQAEQLWTAFTQARRELVARYVAALP
jgi:DNA-binding GntR family transcriptional regulator